MKSFITTLGRVLKLNTGNNGVDSNFNQDKRRLVIPLYQREYRWTTEQVETILRDVNFRDKFLGLIILDEKNKYYEIVDGQQRLTTCLISLIALYNSYAGYSMEQELILPYIMFDGKLTVENDSVSEYFKKVGDVFQLSIQDEDDVYYQKNDFDRVFKVATEFINSLGVGEKIEKRKKFYEKLLASRLLVFINDADDDIRSIEQMFLDINEKTQKLDSESIFKGHCFKIFPEEKYQELKTKWIDLKKVAMRFSQNFGYRDMGQYLYLYLLKDGSIPENMAPKGKHYLEGKPIDKVYKLLEDMIDYGNSLIKFDINIHNDKYYFGDFSKDCYIHRNDKNDIWVMRLLSQNLLESTGAWNQKFPFMHFVANKSKCLNQLKHDNLRKIVSALYAYSNLFLLKRGKKSKDNIDRTIIEEMEKDTVDISRVVDLALGLRNAELEDFEIPETDNFNILIFIFSFVDFYSKPEKFLTYLYSKEKNYNLEHFVIPKRKTGSIDWIINLRDNKAGKKLPNVKKINIDKELAKTYRKRTTNYLIINDELNGEMQSFDIVQKVKAIKEWHDSRKLKLPKHIQLYFEYLEKIESYKKLIEFKNKGEEDITVIQPVYESFIEEYFRGSGLKDDILTEFKALF